MSLETPVVESTPPETETPAEPASIADHAAQFSPDRKEADPDEIPKTPANTGQFANKAADQRHRASTQRATPEDVAEINRLTKELRETEQRLADKDPDAKASPRVRTLKRQIAALKALETPAMEAKPTAQAAPATAAKSGDFSEKDPVFEDFSADTVKYPDPLAAWMKATARYEARKDKWEDQQRQATESQQADEHARIGRWHVKQTEFATKTPDYGTVAAEFFQREIGPTLVQAIVKDDNGPAFVYHLARHPELADELVLLTHGKPADDAFVAVVQRRLSKELQQAQAVSTGSAALPRAYTPPRPPNPVRTGPVKTTDEPPGEAASISEHSKYYGPKRR